MPVLPTETTHVRVVEMSDEVVEVGQGWTTNVWAVAEIDDASGTYPPMRVRVEILKSGNRRKASITELQIGSPGVAVLPRQINALGRWMPDLPAFVLSIVSFPLPDVDPSPDSFIRAMESMIRTPNLTQFEREDEVLHRWENEYEPNGFDQKQAAADMGLKHSTFRTYLAHARARRK